MKRSYVFMVLIVSISMMTLLGCSSKKGTFTSDINNKNISSNTSDSQTTAYNLDPPENIIYYKYGNGIVISKEDPRFEPVFKEIKESIKTINGLYKSKFVVDDLKKEGILLELDYAKKEKLEYISTNNEGKAESIHFTQLYFNLEKKDSGSNTMGVNGDEEGPAGLLSLNYNKLLNLLNN